MKKYSVIFMLVIVFTLGLSMLLVHAGDKSKSAKVIQGTLIDTKCYSMGGFVVNDHKNMEGKKMPNCATACATMGIPVGVLDGGEDVHVLAAPASGYAKWMAQEVRVHGMKGKYADVFIPQKIEVKEDGKWVKKELPQAMM